MANLKLKLSDKSQAIHFKRTAIRSIKIELTQMKAVKNSSNNIRVLGRAVTCKAAPKINSSKLHPIAVVNPKSKSLWYSRSLSLSRNRNVIRSTCTLLSRSTDRALIACDKNRFTRLVGWLWTLECRFRNGRFNLSVTFVWNKMKSGL